MIVDVPLPLTAMPGKPSPQAIRDALTQAYAGSRIVRVMPPGNETLLTIEQASGTDRIELYVFARADGSQARLVAAFDNLGKGASGAALQNLNILAGLDETAGLTL